MRQIKVLKWKEQTPEGEKEADTLKIIKIIMNNRDPKKIKNGLDHHRFFRRVDVACMSAEKTGVLILEEMDYIQIKTIIDEEIPASWGMNSNIFNAVEEFLNAKQVNK